MEKNEKTTRLPFFGIGKVLPFMKPYKKVLFIMVSSEYASSITADGVVDAFVQVTGLDLDIE